ncbi:MAG: FecR family protein [Deinococcota bacterium]
MMKHGIFIYISILSSALLGLFNKYGSALTLLLLWGLSSMESLPKGTLPPVRRKNTRLNLGLLCVLLAASSGLALGQELVNVQGVVEISDGGAWRPVFDTTILAEGERLRTLTNGAVQIQLDDERYIRLHRDTVIARSASGYSLEQGNLYASGRNIVIFMDIPALRLDGEARFDVDGASRRVATFAGTTVASPQGTAVLLSPGQQFFRADETSTVEVSEYFERDPWYLNIVPVDEGGSTINALNGSAEVLLAGEADWQPASLQSGFNLGMSARTGPDSWLELLFESGNIIRLQADTQATFTNYEDLEDGSRRTVLNLSRGTLWTVVEGERERFEVETVGLVAGVRGTTFRTDAASEGATAQIKVFEGNVVGLVEGVGTSIVQDQQFDPDAGVEVLEPDELDAFNLTRDSVLENAATPQLQFELDVNTFILVDTDVLELRGRSQDTVDLVIDGDVFPVNDDGTFSLVLTPPEGTTDIVIIARNEALSSQSIITVTRNTTP